MRIMLVVSFIFLSGHRALAQNPNRPLNARTDPAQATPQAMSHIAPTLPKFRGYTGKLSRPFDIFNLLGESGPRLGLGLGDKLNCLDAGTILSGVIEGDISSDKSKPGDVFAITLPYGYSVDGVKVLPPNTRILGTIVSSISSSQRHNNMPGQLDVSLTTMVLPDGRYAQFSGYIDHNPAFDYRTNPQMKTIKEDFVNYGSLWKHSVTTFLGTVVRHAGLPPFLPFGALKGPEFKLKSGQLLAIKVAEPICLSRLSDGF